MIAKLLPMPLLAAAAFGQHVDLTGRVVDAAGNPVAGAKIAFEPLRIAPPPIPGVQSGYGLAQRLRMRDTRLPRSVTDRDGEWRVSLSPAQAALTTSGLSRFLMTVRSPRHAAWQRCIAGDLRKFGTQDAQLAEKPAEIPLRIQLRGGEPPYVGCAIVERAFRVARNRAIWIGTLVPIAADGTCEFDQRVRIPGEPDATSPTAREEAYRVTVHAASFEPVRVMLPPGNATIDLVKSVWRPRPVLAARAEPAKLPIHATYRIHDEDIVIELGEAKIPLLGDVEPTKVTTGSGEVELDAWDPDVPLFLVDPRADQFEAADDDESEPVRDLPGALEIQIIDKRRQPVFGAGLWIENRAVKRANTRSDVFGVTNSRGIAKLERLPNGTFSVLAHHPDFGIGEVLADVRSGGSKVTCQLRPLQPTQPLASARPGTLLLDFGAGFSPQAEVKTSVGMCDGRNVIWRRFDHRPRFVRIEGVPLGPMTYFTKVGDDAPRFVGGELAGSIEDPAVDPLDIETKTFTIRAVDTEGKPLELLALGMGDKPGRDGKPATAQLFELKPVEPGLFRVEARVRGNLWVEAFAEGHLPKELLLAEGAAADAIIEVKLRIKPPDVKELEVAGPPPPPPANPKAGGPKKQDKPKPKKDSGNNPQ